LLLPVIGKAIGRVDPRPLILFGATMMVASLWLNAGLTQQADTRAMLMPIFVRAMGLGFIFAPLNVTALSDLPADRRGNGAGLFNLTRELGGSIGTAWMSTMLDRHTKEYYTALSAHVSSFDLVTQQQLAQLRGAVAGRVADPTAASWGILGLRMTTQALVRAFDQGFLALGILFAAGLVLVVLLKRPSGSMRAAGGH
jgi:DHA2 family multidrug resistance protein